MRIARLGWRAMRHEQYNDFFEVLLPPEGQANWRAMPKLIYTLVHDMDFNEYLVYAGVPGDSKRDSALIAAFRSEVAAQAFVDENNRILGWPSKSG